MEIPELPGTKECIVDGCNRPGRVAGYCGTHRSRILRKGDPGGAYIPPVMRNKGKSCSVDGCNSGAVCKGMCNMHYRRSKVNQKDRTRRSVTYVPGRVQSRSYERENGASCFGPECDRKAQKLGMCESHYRQDYLGRELEPIRKYRPTTRGMTLEEKVAHYTGSIDENGCALWTGPVDNNGYGLVIVENRKMAAHRKAWSLANGKEIPSGLQVHHICSVRLCVNPDHLQLITQRENKAEMLERKYYVNRIAELEAEVANARKSQ